MLGSLRVDVPTRCSDVEACDVLLLPGGGGVWSLLEDREFLGWLRRVHATTRFTTSVCTGSLLLAAAGLLDGLTAATHWGTAGEIEGHGAVYTPERVVRHDRIITSPGVSSGIDMARHLAALVADRRDHRTGHPALHGVRPAAPVRQRLDGQGVAVEVLERALG